MVKHLTEKQKEKIRYKVNVKKCSVSSVAKKYDSSTQTIYNVLNGRTKMGPNRRTSAISDDVKEWLVETSLKNPEYTSKVLQEMISPVCRISTSAINKYLAKSGVVCSCRKAPIRKMIPDDTEEKKEPSVQL